MYEVCGTAMLMLRVYFKLHHLKWTDRESICSWQKCPEGEKRPLHSTSDSETKYTSPRFLKKILWPFLDHAFFDIKSERKPRLLSFSLGKCSH